MSVLNPVALSKLNYILQTHYPLIIVIMFDLLVIEVLYSRPLQSLPYHFFLLIFERGSYYKLLQLFVAIINNQLFKTIDFEHFKPVQI